MDQPQPPRIHSAALPPGHTPADEGEPQIIFYFRLYAGFVSLSGLGSALLGVYVMVRERTSGGLGFWLVLSAMGTLGFFSHLLGVLCPRRPWMHVVGIVILGVGLLSNCLSWIVNIPLLLYWLKPEVKRWFDAAPTA